MPTRISTIETLARQRLVETTASFWTSAELVEIIAAGERDLWRPIVDLRAEHYLIINTTDVTLPANSNELLGVPADVHKIYLIEPADVTSGSGNGGLIFKPKDWNHPDFANARTQQALAPNDTVIYFAVTAPGAPVAAPRVRTAPQVTADVDLAFSYVPTLGERTADSIIQIPGEADNALIAWTVAFARAKESEDRAPDANWLAVYASEKAHLLSSLGIRQLQEPMYVDALFEAYWE